MLGNFLISIFIFFFFRFKTFEFRDKLKEIIEIEKKHYVEKDSV